jgi:hypothetical protein
MNPLHLQLAKKNREVDASSWETVYESLIIRKIRKRYSVNQELAILRQRDSKPTEFAAYNEYVEQCKAEAKKEME